MRKNSIQKDLDKEQKQREKILRELPEQFSIRDETGCKQHRMVDINFYLGERLIARFQGQSYIQEPVAEQFEKWASKRYGRIERKNGI